MLCTDPSGLLWYSHKAKCLSSLSYLYKVIFLFLKMALDQMKLMGICSNDIFYCTASSWTGHWEGKQDESLEAQEIDSRHNEMQIHISLSILRKQTRDWADRIDGRRPHQHILKAIQAPDILQLTYQSSWQLHSWQQEKIIHLMIIKDAIQGF